MMFIEETQQKMLIAKWAIINQASEMPGIKIHKIVSKFFNKHFKYLLDNTEKESATSNTINLLSSEEEEVGVEVNDEGESSSSIRSSNNDDEHET
jgi:hypothetical protein